MSFRHAVAPCLAAALLSPLAFAQPTTAPTDAADAKAAGTACVRAIIEGDLTTAATFMIEDPAETATAETLAGVFDAQRALAKSIEAKFGPTANAGADMMDPKQALTRFERMQADVQGDTAGLHSPGATRSEVTLKKVDGAWKVTSLTGGPANRGQVTKMMVPMKAAIDTTIQDVDAGKFASAADAKKSLMDKVMAAAMAGRPDVQIPRMQPATQLAK